MQDSMLHDLRLVSDETLFARLVVLRQSFPKNDTTAEDWFYRCSTWEMANNAVREEIRRRKAKPPEWCVIATPPPKPRRGIFIAGSVLTILPVVAILGMLASR